MPSHFSRALIPSQAITATVNSDLVQTASPLTMGTFIVTVSAFTSGSITPAIQGQDPATGNFYNILTGTAMTAAGTQLLRVGYAFTGSAGATAQDFLPENWRVVLTAAGGTSLTASVGANLAP